MTKKRVNIFLIITILIAIIGIGAWFGFAPDQQPRFYASISEVLSDHPADDGFKRAIEVIPFHFPRDFGTHPDFQTEWWYYTGNLQNETGDHFGYQLTIFRRALSPEKTNSGSQWRTNQIYFAHLAVTDVKSNRFYSFERFSREAIGLAGARSEPYRIWVENWQIKEENGLIHLLAEEENISLNLSLSSIKAIVFQGNNGLSQKGSGQGNASYYYSQTRIDTKGTVKIGDTSHIVKGDSWLDREWSTSTLQRGDIGWDWFSIQLNDNREIMLFQIRAEDGSISDYSSGMFVFSNGQSLPLTRGSFSITAVDKWKSPETGIVYPSGWNIALHDMNLKLLLVPYIKNQEHQLSFAYWEGAVKVKSNQGDGFGYVELTGYEKSNR